MKLLTFAILLITLTKIHTLYDSSSPVVLLDNSNFDKKVLQDETLWLVEFYAPWCGHCKALSPEYLTVAQKLKGLIKIGAVDADKNQELAGRFNVKGYPTLKIFGANKRNPIDYTGQRNSESIIKALIKHIENAALKSDKSVFLKNI